MTDKQLLRVAQVRIRKLERVLRPFAQESTEWLGTISDRYHPGVTEPGTWQASAKASFMIGDLRRAYKLVASA